MEEHIQEVLPLGFGKCKLQIQVPEHGEIQTVDGLVGKRIATSFEYVAAEYFNPLDDAKGLTDGQKTKIEYVGGSVEAACALGLADGIGACPPFKQLCSALETNAIHGFSLRFSCS